MNESTEPLKVELVNAKSMQDELLSALLAATITVVVSTAGTMLAQALLAKQAKKAAKDQKIAQESNPA